MDILIAGAGKMGSVAAQTLAQRDDVDRLTVTDLDDDHLERLEADLPKGVTTQELDVTSDAAVAVLEEHDAALLALPRRDIDYQAIENCIAAGTDAVDLLEEYHRRPSDDVRSPEGMDREEYGEHLHERAREEDVLVISGCGLAPGLTNITLQHGIDQLDTARSAIARVGGLPAQAIAADHPLKYAVTWALGHVWREYDMTTLVRTGGELEEVHALDELETFIFDALDHHEQLECFITPGMPSFLYTHPDLEEFREKTIRWPGHHDQVEALDETGMLSTEVPDELDMAPREFLTQLLRPRMELGEGERDVAIMHNTVTGTRDGEEVIITYDMWEYANLEAGISAMGRTTAIPAAEATAMLADGAFTATGIRAPEEVITGDRYEQFIDRLRTHDITIDERVQYIE